MVEEYESLLRAASSYRQRAETEAGKKTVDGMKSALNFYKKAVHECSDAYKVCKDYEQLSLIKKQADIYTDSALEINKVIEEFEHPERSIDRISRSRDKKIKADDEKEDVQSYKGQFSLERPDSKFSEVIGMKRLKDELKLELTNSLGDKSKYSKYIDADESSGFLLYGPPGCGKTMFAKAAAGELKVGFIEARASDLLGSYVGQSEKKVRALFEFAAENQPCILLIDEIDGLGKALGSGSVYSDRFVSELKSDFNLIKDKKVIVLAATNYIHLVESALIRSGRIGEHFLIGPPDSEAKVGMYKRFLKDLNVDKEIDYRLLAEYSKNFVGADIKLVAKIAGKYAIRRGAAEKGDPINLEDFLCAIKDVGQNIQIYNWASKVKRAMNKNDSSNNYPDLEKLIGDIENSRDYSAPQNPPAENSAGAAPTA